MVIGSLQMVYVKFKVLPTTETKPTRLCMDVLSAPIKGKRVVVALEEWPQKQVERAGFRVLFEEGKYLYAERAVELFDDLVHDDQVASVMRQLCAGL